MAMHQKFISVLFLIMFSLPTFALGSTVVVRGDANDTIPLDLNDYTVYGNGGIDTIILPLFPNEYQFSLTGPSQYTAHYLGFTSVFDSIEYVQFGSTSKTKLSIGSMTSGDVQTQLARLTDLYLAFFGRAPDVSGLEYWQMQLLQLGKDFATISKDFSWSTEAQALFPTGGSNRDFVRTVYQNCFGRDPDQGGWDYWTNVLNELDPQNPEYLNDRGAFVGELLLGAYAPTSGEEDRSLLTNRHEVAMYYVNRLSMQPGEGFDPAINDLLARVSMDNSTRYNAENLIDHVFSETMTMSTIMGNQGMFMGLWTHDPDLDVDNDGDGWSEIQGDCNDALTAINPAAFEVCNDGVDQDCNGADRICPEQLDNDGDGWSEVQGDCNDALAAINPGAAEICGDGIDQNCDGFDLACTGSGSCNNAPTLSQLAGTWDLSEDYGSAGLDEMYLVLNANGSYTLYDYAGDTFDAYASCYWAESASLTNLGNGQFRDNSDGTTATISLCDGRMSLSSGNMTITYPRTTKNNFAPVCQ